MGLLVDGQWHDQWYDTSKSGGEFVRTTAQFRHWITQDGSPGPNNEPGLPAEKDRYHLFVSLACPWAHRTLIFRKLKQLDSIIGVSVVHPDMLENGWEFNGSPEDADGTDTRDHLFQSKYLYQIYTRADPDYTGRVTVPVLWDKKQSTIVSNESSEIIRMFNSAFNKITGNKNDYYPEELRAAIDTINDPVYHQINNGVYKSGFATTQHAYEKAVTGLFNELDNIEKILTHSRYLTGNRITEADWRLFTTLFRFDPVYVGHFKCNLKRIADYPAISGYLRELYQHPGVADTCNLAHCKRHYYFSHTMINPTGIVPKGPEIDYNQPHNRDQL